MQVIIKRRKCWLWFPIRFTKYVIAKSFGDDIELIITKGLISKHEEKIKLFKVQDISYNRSVGNFFMGVGNITIASSDISAKFVEIEKIRRAKKFQEKLEELVELERSSNNVTYKEASVL